MVPARRIAVHGHRGARAVFPENTLPAFLHAIRAGADAIELDLAVTRDNVLVATHDPVLSRRCTAPAGSRIVRELAFEELRLSDCGSRRNARFPRQAPVPGVRIPSLDEVFELAACGRFQFDLEAKVSPAGPKPERFAALLVQSVRRRRLEERVVVLCFDFRLLREVRRLAPELRLGALCGLGGHNFVEIARRAGAGIVAPYHRLATARRVAAAQAAGLEVLPWTANRPRDWQRLIHAGVDGIITDDPAGLIAFLDGRL